jgi:3'-phosphoadenosine 5'-phosphosulfate sulfotransferase (PAPS reductase)/FAD synthetase
MDEGIDFEAVFVDHGGDWPETYEYVEMFSKKYPLTLQ